MPTSPYVHIEYVAMLLVQLRPSSVLDIGLGNGKMGFIARDILDVMYGERYHKGNWQIRIDGIEAYKDYIQDHQRYIYDNIYIGDAYEVIDRLGSYDIVILGDVLEHFPKDRAWLFLDKCALHSNLALIVNIPIGPAPQPAIYDNDYERHLSEWHVEELTPYCTDSRQWTLTSGMRYGSFLINKDSYLLQRATVLFKEANRLKDEGQQDRAINLYSYLLKLRPKVPEFYNNLGTVYVEKNYTREALSCFKKAVELNPNFAVAFFNLANAYRDLGNHAQAIENYLRAIELDPLMADATYNLGNLFRKLGRYDEALVAYETTIRMDNTFGKAYNNRGAILYQKGLVSEAIELYKKAIELDNNDADAHWNLSLALLLKGNFKEGWPLYEWRFKTKDFPPRDLPMPLWDGGSSEGTILLHAEQGLGDAIHFVRYVPLVAKKGLRVILQCHSELVRLFETIKDIERCISFAEQVPPCDFHSPLMSLPMLFKTDLNSIPNDVPYLHIPPTVKAFWASKTKNGPNLKVGLVWAGKPEYKNDHIRSVSLSLFEPLMVLEGIELYSLQLGSAGREADRYPKIIDLTRHINDFLDTAGLVSNLDLVISVDTAVAHLAGAMAKPVWIMLPYCPDWRWMLNRHDSPWYPTARLFRQEAYGDWHGVISRLKAEVRMQTKGNSH